MFSPVVLPLGRTATMQRVAKKLVAVTSAGTATMQKRAFKAVSRTTVQSAEITRLTDKGLEASTQAEPTVARAVLKAVSTVAVQAVEMSRVICLRPMTFVTAQTASLVRLVGKPMRVTALAVPLLARRLVVAGRRVLNALWAMFVDEEG